MRLKLRTAKRLNQVEKTVNRITEAAGHARRPPTSASIAALPPAGVEGDGAGADAEGAGAAAGALFSEDSGLALVALPPSLLLSARLRFLSLSDLKSVSYQPLPANRNEGALTRRLSCGAPQLGQIVGSSGRRPTVSAGDRIDARSWRHSNS